MADGDPTVSVVIPTYNRAAVLGRSIESVLSQTYRDFELLIVDDGSTDETRCVIESYDDDRIRYLRQDFNEGAPAARNRGIRAANGEFIAFQDSDDRWHAGKLEHQMNAFENAPPTVGVVYTGFWRAEDDTNFWRDTTGGMYLPGPDVETKEGDIHESLLRENFISTQVVVVRTECLEAVGGFDESLSACQDWELWIRLSERYEFALVDEPLVTSWLQPDSIGSDMEIVFAGRERVIRKHRDAFDTDTLAAQLFWLGHVSLRLGRPKRGRRYLFSATRAKATPLFVICLFLSIFGSGLYNTVYGVYRRQGLFGVR